MVEQVALLQLQHFQVFAENLGLPFADAGRQRLVFRVELARHAPEVPDRGFGLGRDEVHHDAVGLVFGRRVIAAFAGMGHADFDHHMAGQRKAADLPAVHRHVVGQVVAAQRQLPERRRGDVFHKAAGDDLIAIDDGLAWHFVDFLLADAAGMDVGFMRQVHQVVDHQPVVALDVEHATAVGPFRVVIPVLAGNFCRVGQRGITRPDPDEAVALFNRVAADLRKASHALTRHGNGFAFATHFQSVVSADQFAFAHEAQRQRRATVRAEVFERSNTVFLAPVEHDALAADHSAQRLVVDVLRGAGNVPGVFGEHDG